MDPILKRIGDVTIERVVPTKSSTTTEKEGQESQNPDDSETDFSMSGEDLSDDDATDIECFNSKSVDFKVVNNKPDESEIIREVPKIDPTDGPPEFLAVKRKFEQSEDEGAQIELDSKKTKQTTEEIIDNANSKPLEPHSNLELECMEQTRNIPELSDNKHLDGNESMDDMTDDEYETSESEGEDSPDSKKLKLNPSTSADPIDIEKTDFIEKLAQGLPFDDSLVDGKDPNEKDGSSTSKEGADTSDYDYDITEKLREMGEISVQPVKKGEVPMRKMSLDEPESEISVTAAKKHNSDTDSDDEKSGVERKIGNLRRNIREVMDETKLDEATLAAQRQEMERLRRVQEQQRIIREVQRQIALNRQNNKTQHRVISLLQGGTSTSVIRPSSSGSASASNSRIPGNTVLVKLPNGETKSMTRLPKGQNVFEMIRTHKSINLQEFTQNKSPSPRNIVSNKGHITPSVSIAPVAKKVMPTSDSEMEAATSKAGAKPKKDVETIDVSSSDDDCIVLSEDEEPEPEPDEDPSNSGMHTNDAYNIPDDQGRVLINVGHPENEADIFLAPQIARVIKPHQIGGVRFLFDNVIESVERFSTSTGFGCILAHSMGLGKTLQVVCFSDIFLRHTTAKTILCIMPINTLQNWVAEFNMWLPTDTAASPLLNHGEVRPRNFALHVLNDSHKSLTARARIIQEWNKDGGVLLIGYELYRLLSLKRNSRSKKKKKPTDVVDLEEDDKNKTMFDEIHAALVKPGPDLVICDEGHRIKNSHASISQALKQIRSKRRVVLTGYPLQNNLLEYWCMVDFVRPNYLGSKTEFSNMFERPIQNGQCVDSTPQDVRLMRFRAHVLHSLLEGFVQRRSHAVLQITLPQKEEYVMLVRMTSFQRKLYDTFMNDVVRTKTVPNPLKAFAVCCKIWNHPDVLYYFLKKREESDAVDIDLEEVAGVPQTPGAIGSLPATPTSASKRSRARSRATTPRKDNRKLNKQVVVDTAKTTPIDKPAVISANNSDSSNPSQLSSPQTPAPGSFNTTNSNTPQQYPTQQPSNMPPYPPNSTYNPYPPHTPSSDYYNQNTNYPNTNNSYNNYYPNQNNPPGTYGNHSGYYNQNYPNYNQNNWSNNWQHSEQTPQQHPPYAQNVPPQYPPSTAGTHYPQSQPFNNVSDSQAKDAPQNSTNFPSSNSTQGQGPYPNPQTVATVNPSFNNDPTKPDTSNPGYFNNQRNTNPSYPNDPVKSERSSDAPQSSNYYNNPNNASASYNNPESKPEQNLAMNNPPNQYFNSNISQNTASFGNSNEKPSSSNYPYPGVNSTPNPAPSYGGVEIKTEAGGSQQPMPYFNNQSDTAPYNNQNYYPHHPPYNPQNMYNPGMYPPSNYGQYSGPPPWQNHDIKTEIKSELDIKPEIKQELLKDEEFDDKLKIKNDDIKMDCEKKVDVDKIENVDGEDEGGKDDEVKVEMLPTAKLKEDAGINYDWAVELLKGYVPGCIENSAKMEILFCIIRESMALGDRILLFSQSLFTLNLIEELLQRYQVPGLQDKWARNLNYYRLDGSTSALEREKLINEFNANPNIHLFMVSTRAGSLGINLVGANRVVVFDASWNPCHDTQAVCRVYRYGQKKPCFVYRLVMDNCLEKKIYDRQINKQGMADRVVDECNPDAHLSMKDVTNLCWDDEKDSEIKDFSSHKDKYIDVVMQKVLDNHSHVLSKEPFQHESLLVDRKEKKLSQAEKRMAKRSYEMEKQAVNNAARSAAYSYHGGLGTGIIQRGMRIAGDGSMHNKPIASVRPMQAELNSQVVRDGQRRTRWIPAEVWQRQGMTAQEMTLPLDVVIPTNGGERGNIVLKAGQKVLVLKSPKGIYMQLECGKIVAIRTAMKMRGNSANAPQGGKIPPGASTPKSSDEASSDGSLLKKVNQRQNLNTKTIPLPLKNNSAVTITPKINPQKLVKPFTQVSALGKMNKMPGSRTINARIQNIRYPSKAMSPTLQQRNMQLGKANPFNMEGTNNIPPWQESPTSDVMPDPSEHLVKSRDDPETHIIPSSDDDQPHSTDKISLSQMESEPELHHHHHHHHHQPMELNQSVKLPEEPKHLDMQHNYTPSMMPMEKTMSEKIQDIPKLPEMDEVPEPPTFESKSDSRNSFNIRTDSNSSSMDSQVHSDIYNMKPESKLDFEMTQEIHKPIISPKKEAKPGFQILEVKSLNKSEMINVDTNTFSDTEINTELIIKPGPQLLNKPMTSLDMQKPIRPITPKSSLKNYRHNFSSQKAASQHKICSSAPIPSALHRLEQTTSSIGAAGPGDPKVSLQKSLDRITSDAPANPQAEIHEEKPIMLPTDFAKKTQPVMPLKEGLTIEAIPAKPKTPRKTPKKQIFSPEPEPQTIELDSSDNESPHKPEVETPQPPVGQRNYPQNIEQHSSNMYDYGYNGPVPMNTGYYGYNHPMQPSYSAPPHQPYVNPDVTSNMYHGMDHGENKTIQAKPVPKPDNVEAPVPAPVTSQPVPDNTPTPASNDFPRENVPLPTDTKNAPTTGNATPAPGFGHPYPPQQHMMPPPMNNMLGYGQQGQYPPPPTYPGMPYPNQPYQPYQPHYDQGYSAYSAFHRPEMMPYPPHPTPEGYGPPTNAPPFAPLRPGYPPQYPPYPQSHPQPPMFPGYNDYNQYGTPGGFNQYMNPSYPANPNPNPPPS